MKQNKHVRLFSLGLVFLVLVTVNCARNQLEPDHEVAEQLLSLLNKQLPGSQFNTKLENSIVKPTENNRCWVTFKHMSFTTDLAWIIKFFYRYLPGGSYPEKYTARVEEMIFLYGPKEKYLRLRETKGLTIDLNCSELARQEGFAKVQDFMVNRIHFSIANITHKNLDISELIKSGKKDLLESIKAAFESSDSTMENLKFKVSGRTKNKENLTILLEIEKIASIKEGTDSPDESVYVFKKDSPLPELLETLQKGLSITDLNIEVGEVKVSIKKNDIYWGGGTLDNVFYSLFLKPDKARASFNGGLSFGIKNMELSIPGKPDIELFSKIDEFRFAFSVEHLSPQAVLAFIDLIKKSIELRDLSDDSKMLEVRFQVMKLLIEVMKSKALASFSISPFKHYFGEIYVNAKMQIPTDLFSWPYAKMTMELLKTDDILKKLKNSNLFSPAALKSFSEILEHMVRKENGNATLTWELKSDQPGKYFFNGNLMERKK